MPKPWGRIELDYINHDKFKALNANAMCLWHEGKNYCDIRLTDGLIPTATAKLFRFYSKKAAAFLLVSAGQKPGTADQYAPLWELIAGFGFKMHDYLDHNEGREVVIERIAQAAESKQANQDRLKRWRDEKKAIRNATETPVETPSETPTATVSETPKPTISACTKRSIQQQQQLQKQLQAVPSEQQQGGGSKRPLFTGQRLTVFEWFLDRATQVLGPHLDDFHIDEWFYTLDAQAVASGQVIPSRDNGAWLESQLLAEARRRGLPIAVAAAPVHANKRITGLIAGGEAFLKRQG